MNPYSFWIETSVYSWKIETFLQKSTSLPSYQSLTLNGGSTYISLLDQQKAHLQSYSKKISQLFFPTQGTSHLQFPIDKIINTPKRVSVFRESQVHQKIRVCPYLQILIELNYYLNLDLILICSNKWTQLSHFTDPKFESIYLLNWNLN